MDTIKIPNNSREKEVPKKYPSARMYFKNEVFAQYVQENIDSRLSSRNLSLGAKSLFRDEKGTGTIFRARNLNSESEVLITSYVSNKGDQDEIGFSAVKNVMEFENTNTADEIIYYNQRLISRISPEDRPRLLKYLADFKPSSEQQELASLELFDYLIKFFPEIAESDKSVPVEINIPEKIKVSFEQKAELTKSLQLTLSRIPAEYHDEILEKLLTNWSFVYSDSDSLKSEFFGREIFENFIDTALTRKFPYESDLEYAKFELEIGTEIASEPEYLEALKKLSQQQGEPLELPAGTVIEPEPNYALISLEDVVGGYNMNIPKNLKSDTEGEVSSAWEISDSAGRGRENILKLIKMFQQERSFKTNNPISYVQIDNKLYSYGDGRHRTVALKLLGVKQIPAIVYKPEQSKN